MNKLWLSIGFVATALCYLGLLAAPPRIELHEDDTICYMTQAHDLTLGRPVGNHHYPTGYAHILAMAHVDLGRPWYRVVAINLAFIVIGLCATFFLLQRTLSFSSTEAAFICLLSLGSWMLVTYASRQLPELAFLGISAACLWCGHVSRTTGRFKTYLALTLILAFAAITVRSAGVALVPVMLFVASQRIKNPLRLGILSVACAFGVVFGMVLRDRLMSPTYSEAFTKTIAHPFATVGSTTLWRLREIGEVGQNASPQVFEEREQTAYGDDSKTAKAGDTIGVTIDNELRSLSYVVGAVFLFLIVAGSLNKPFSVVDLYLMSYFFVLLIYPFGTSRFLVPIVPLILGYAWLGAKRVALPKWLPISYVAVYCLLGLIAMGSEWVIVLQDRSRANRSFDDIVDIFRHRMGIKL